MDECLTDNGGCAQICTNNNGSFLCYCETGYTLSLDDLGCDGRWWSHYILLGLTDVEMWMNVLRTLVVVLRHVLTTMALSCVLVIQGTFWDPALWCYSIRPSLYNLCQSHPSVTSSLPPQVCHLCLSCQLSLIHTCIRTFSLFHFDFFFLTLIICSLHTLGS